MEYCKLQSIDIEIASLLDVLCKRNDLSRFCIEARMQFLSIFNGRLALWDTMINGESFDSGVD